MTKDEAARHKHWIILHAGGTPLQVWSAKDLCWYDSPNPSFRLKCIYRVKPVETELEKSVKAFTTITQLDPNKVPVAFNCWEDARRYYTTYHKA